MFREKGKKKRGEKNVADSELVGEWIRKKGCDRKETMSGRESPPLIIAISMLILGLA